MSFRTIIATGILAGIAIHAFSGSNTGDTAMNEKPIVAGFIRSGEDCQERNPYTDMDTGLYTRIYHLGHLQYDPKSKHVSSKEGVFPNKDMANYFRRKNIKVFLSIGLNSNSLTSLEDIQAFAGEVVSLALKNNYDGIDTDWEYPVDFKNYANKEPGKLWDALYAALRGQINTHPTSTGKLLLLSATTSPGDWVIKYLDVAAMRNNIDSVNLMTYDIALGRAGNHAPLFADPADNAGVSVAKEVDTFVQKGYPKERILIGMPFHSIVYTGCKPYDKFDNKTMSKSDLGYKGFMRRVEKERWTTEKEPVSGTQWYFSPDGKSFAAVDGPAEILQKSEYFKSQGYGGVFCWSAELDEPGSPLAAAMAKPWLGERSPKTVRSLQLAGCMPYRDFGDKEPQYSVEYSSIEYLTDAILLNGSPNLTDLNANWKSKAIDEFKTACSGRNVGRWYCTNPGKEKADTLMTDEATLSSNAEAVTQFLVINDFDGLTIDWEYPEPRQWPAYSRYIVELKKHLAKQEKMLSLCLSGWGVNLTPEAIKSIDFVYIMSYDRMGSDNKHSTFSTAVHDVEFFLQKGFSPKQLVLGIPFYGRSTSEKQLKHSPWLFHNGLEASYKNLAYLSPEMPPSQDIIDGYFFNGMDMVRKKARLALAYDLAGVMIFEMGFDLPVADRRSLLRAIVETAPPAKAKPKHLPRAIDLPIPWTGGLSCDLWIETSFESVDAFTNSQYFKDKPSYKSYLYSPELPKAWSKSGYGVRAYGFITPKNDGQYAFCLNENSECVLFLSSDSNPANRKLIAKTAKGLSMSEKESVKSPESKSEPILMKANQDYYIEVIFVSKDGSGQMSVTWISPGEEAPSAIPCKCLRPFNTRRANDNP